MRNYSLAVWTGSIQTTQDLNFSQSSKPKEQAPASASCFLPRPQISLNELCVKGWHWPWGGSHGYSPACRSAFPEHPDREFHRVIIVQITPRGNSRICFTIRIKNHRLLRSRFIHSTLNTSWFGVGGFGFFGLVGFFISLEEKQHWILHNFKLSY